MSSGQGVPVSLIHHMIDGSLRLQSQRNSFPRHEPSDAAHLDALLAEIGPVLDAYCDGNAIDETNCCPSELIDTFRRSGLFGMLVPQQIGGLALSRINAFETVRAVMTRSVGAGQVLALTNGIGVPAYWSVAPDGPVKHYLERAIRRRPISGQADTEAGGAFNRSRSTVARGQRDGSYLLTGEKVFCGNAAYRPILSVTASVTTATNEIVGIFFVDTAEPGVYVGPTQSCMGFRGAGMATVFLNDVRVPSEQVMPLAPGGFRATPEVMKAMAWGRTLIIAAPALAILQNCRDWASEFARHRVINGTRLTESPVVRSLLQQAAGNTFAVDTLVRWCLLDHDAGDVDVSQEVVALKSIAAELCWETADHTMSLFGAQGYECASSKEQRGAWTLPLERAMRDARGLRIGGGVDYYLDVLAGSELLRRAAAAGYTCGFEYDRDMFDRELRGFVDCAAEALREAASNVRRSVGTLGVDAAIAGQNIPMQVRRLLREVTSLVLVASRASADSADAAAHAAAKTYCSAVERRLGALTRELAQASAEHLGSARMDPGASSTGLAFARAGSDDLY